MKKINLLGLLVAGACTFQACQSPESRGAKNDSTSTDSATHDSTTNHAATLNDSPNSGTKDGGKMDNSGGAAAETEMSSTSTTTSKSSKDSMPKDVTNQSKVDNDEATFMKTAAVGGMMEVDLGKIALKSTNPKVKAFAEQMVKDHTKANNELKALAASSGIVLPTAYPEEDKAHAEMMKKMTGNDFDKHYIGMMVTDHDKTIALFKTATTYKTKSVKDFAKKTLPVINGHYEKAKAIQAELK